MPLKKPTYPVTDEHILVVPNTIVCDSIDLSESEYVSLFREIKEYIIEKEQQDPAIAGWNVFCVDNNKADKIFFWNVVARYDEDGEDEIKWYANLGKYAIY